LKNAGAVTSVTVYGQFIFTLWTVLNWIGTKLTVISPVKGMFIVTSPLSAGVVPWKTISLHGSVKMAEKWSLIDNVGLSTRET
jgi:hypothetical protein